MCPIEAFTSNAAPRYLLIVLALAGDSTITNDLLLEKADFAIAKSGMHFSLVLVYYSVIPSRVQPPERNAGSSQAARHGHTHQNRS